MDRKGLPILEQKSAYICLIDKLCGAKRWDNETSRETWLGRIADTIGIGCMWFVAAIDLVILRKLDDARWAFFRDRLHGPDSPPRRTRPPANSKANVTREPIGAIVTEQARAVKCVEIWTDNERAASEDDRVEGAMLKQKGN